MSRSCLCILLLLMSASLPAQEKQPRLDHAGDPLPTGAMARLGTLRWRHGSEVTALAYAPDGNMLASSGRDGAIRLWETTSGKQLRELRGHKGEVRSIAFASDGKLLASGGTEGMVRFWDASSGRALHALQIGKEWVNTIAFSPDGKLLAVGDDSRDVRLWDVSGKKLLRVIAVGHPVQGLSFTRDGKHLCVSGSEGEGVELWPVEGGKKVRRFGAWPHSFCLADGDKLVVVADHDLPLSVYAFNTAERLRILKEQDVELRPRLAVVAASPAGPRVAVGSADGQLRVCNAETGRQDWSTQAGPGSIKAVTFSPDGKRVAAAGALGSILIWDAASGNLQFPLRGHAFPVASVSLSPDGKRVATAARIGAFELWKADTGEKLGTLAEALMDCFCVAFSPDDKLLATSRLSGEIQLREASTGKLIRTLKGHEAAATCLAFTHDGKHLVSGGRDRVLRLWDVATGEARGTTGGPGNGRIESLAVSHDERSALLADGSASPRLLDFSGGVLAEFDGPDGGCLAVALSPSGRVAATGGRDNMVRLWEVVSGQQRRALGGGFGWVHALAWSSNGKLLASGHADGRVCLWDARTGLRLRELAGHRGAVQSLSFSADARRLVSGNTDTTAVVWDLSGLGQSPRPEPLKLSPERLAALWKDLLSTDGPTAGEALQTLARDPEQSLNLLRKNVRVVSEEDVQKLLRDLDSQKFTVRDRASLDLIALGRFIEPILREELRGKPTLEMRRRMAEILKLITEEGRSPEETRTFRGLELLEMLGTPAAKKLLQELAGGAARWEIAREAKAILERLPNRPKDLP